MPFISRWRIVVCNASLRLRLIDYGLRDYGTAKWIGGDPNCEHSPQKPDGGERANRTVPPGRGGVYREVCAKCGAVRVDDQLGLESTPEEYIANMVEVFREVKRVLRDDGTLWLNISDSYAGSNRGASDYREIDGLGMKPRTSYTGQIPDKSGLKPKDLMMIPARLALALQADGWYVRSDIIYSKKIPMPESVKDRPTRSHEYVFLLTKSAKYYYDAEAIKEPYTESINQRGGTRKRNPINEKFDPSNMANANSLARKRDIQPDPNGRNRRSVWTISTQPTSFAHFAVMPEKLVEPCILAGSKPGDIIFDPFAGSGTVERVAIRLGRESIGLELNFNYIADIAKRRTSQVQVRLPIDGD